MPLLPAVVPEATEKRADRVPTRLAHNVAPLFGVDSPHNPFTPLTWLCDFNLITISEIARGAPLPRRPRSGDTGTSADQGWVVRDRAIVAPRGGALPNEIISATTNRYGPHTKSALLLTASNVLLAPVTAAVETVVPLLRAADGGDLPLRLRVVAWATTIVEAFRSQPVLLVAALKARVTQREFLDSPRLSSAASVRTREPARCEIGADGDQHRDPVTHPRDLFLLDRTVRVLGLPQAAAFAEDAAIDPEPDDVRSPARNLGDEMVEHLVRLLLDASHPEGVGRVWASEVVPGRAVAEAVLPSSGIVEDLVDHWFTVHPHAAVAARRSVPPVFPTAAEIAELGTAARRALVLAALGVVRSLRPGVGKDGFAPAAFLDVVDRLTSFADDCLAPGDPVHAVLHVRLPVLRLAVLRHNRVNDLVPHVAALVAGGRTAVGLLRRGDLDRGTVADLLGAACVELNGVRTTNATDPAAGLPAPADLIAVLRELWDGYAEALEVDLRALDPEADRDVGFHLHNYASFLGSLPDRADQREAVRLFRDFVIPSRKRLYRRLQHFGPLGVAYSVATAATSRLGEWERANGDPRAAAEWAALGHRWISRAMEHNAVDTLVGEVTAFQSMFALRAAPALLLAVETGVAPAEREVPRVRRLLSVVDRWVAATAGDREADFNRHAEVEAVRARVAALAVDVGTR
ncbi:hypothetical protein [Actinosynnema sp. NPDC020468]|uniref:hypothetical protein n=1 Tax=Actinosynnema sp. NPDC020468 TaxID=3154488 RepID=UPI0033CC1116